MKVVAVISLIVNFVFVAQYLSLQKSEVSSSYEDVSDNNYATTLPKSTKINYGDITPENLQKELLMLSVKIVKHYQKP